MHSQALKRNVITLIVLLAFLLVIGGVLFWKSNAPTPQTGQVLLADSAFLFDCKGEDRTVLETDIGEFLLSEGFRVLNLGKIQREHGIHLLETEIIGLNEKRGIIEFVNLPSSKGTYSVGFTSPPPTRHSSHIEEALLAFAKNKLNCEVRQRSGGDNGSEATDFYNSEVQRIEGLFREAKELQGKKG